LHTFMISKFSETHLKWQWEWNLVRLMQEQYIKETDSNKSSDRKVYCLPHITFVIKQRGFYFLQLNNRYNFCMHYSTAYVSMKMPRTKHTCISALLTGCQTIQSKTS
jgi:hypothetical protein